MGKSEQAKRIDLYSIAGYFIESYVPKTEFCFGGFFKHNPRTKRLEGRLIDYHGSSEIRGEMSADSLEMVKYYSAENCNLNCNLVWNYKFKNENGIWIGEYVLCEKFNVDPKSFKGGKTEASIKLVNKDAIFMKSFKWDFRSHKDREKPNWLSELTSH